MTSVVVLRGLQLGSWGCLVATGCIGFVRRKETLPHIDESYGALKLLRSLVAQCCLLAHFQRRETLTGVEALAL